MSSSIVTHDMRGTLHAAHLPNGGDNGVFSEVSPVGLAPVPQALHRPALEQQHSRDSSSQNNSLLYQSPNAQPNPLNHAANGSSTSVWETNRMGHEQYNQTVEVSHGVSAYPNRVQRLDTNQTFEPDYFGPNMISSLNWLPTEYPFANPEEEMYGFQISPQLIPGLPIEAQAPFFPFQDIANAVNPANTASQHDGSQSSYTSPSQSMYENTSPLGTISRVSGSDLRRGSYYVDGDGARLPRNGRRRNVKIPLTTESPFTQSSLGDGSASPGFAFPDISFTDDVESGLRNIPFMSEGIYHAIHQCFNETCAFSSPFIPFSTPHFLPLNVLDRFVQLYVQYHQPLFPFLHLPTLDLTKSHWLLSLALASIGSHYVEVEWSDITTMAMHEFLRRAILIVVSPPRLSVQRLS
jgi:hypothetical protein